MTNFRVVQQRTISCIYYGGSHVRLTENDGLQTVWKRSDIVRLNNLIT